MTVLRYHFSGIAGAGMGPLACLMRVRGHQVQGSDRAFDQGKKQDIAAQLRGAGIELAPQDGTAITAAINRLIYSAAVEADTPGAAVLTTSASSCGLGRHGRPSARPARSSGVSASTAAE